MVQITQEISGFLSSGKKLRKKPKNKLKMKPKQINNTKPKPTYLGNFTSIINGNESTRKPKKSDYNKYKHLMQNF